MARSADPTGLMKCEQCENFATVHLTQIDDGVKTELHLCVECSRSLEATMPDGPMRDLLRKLIASMKTGK
jgi:protein-arginine kinase activator protein McsA